MSSALDMSLDDIIKTNKKSSAGGISRGRGGPGGPGPARRIPNRPAYRPSPYSIMVKAPDSAWQNDMFKDQTMMAAYPAPGAAVRASAIETGTKLYISNLDYGVSNEDIKELFAEVGDIKRHSIHYDRSGRSKGTAEVVFSRRADALAALKRYNNVQLDGKPMKIEILMPPVVPLLPPNGGFGNTNGFPKSGPVRGGPSGWPRGGGGGRGRGRGRGRGGRGRGEPVSVADLDAELDKYHSESMQIN